eukprot:Sspe_Gene.57809::Locus_31720_Transcript_1_1_Confidence_1.000_Length_3684::g.57809::m.57809
MVRCLTGHLVIAVALAAWGCMYGALQSRVSLETLAKVHVSMEARLADTPHEKRNLMWKAGRRMSQLFERGLLLRYNGDRGSVFRLMQAEAGNRFVYNGGQLALAAWDDVAEVLNQSHRFFHSADVGYSCNTNDPSLVVGNASRVVEVRDILLDALEAVSKEQRGKDQPPLTHEGEGDEPSDTLEKVPWAVGSPEEAELTFEMLMAVARRYWVRVFGVRPSKAAVEALRQYLRWRGTCWMGVEQEALSSLGMDSSSSAMTALEAEVDATPLGQEALRLGGEKGIPREAVTQYLARAFLFNGVLAAHHVVTGALWRLQASPDENSVLWEESPEAFLKEVSRLAPPIATVSTFFSKDREVVVSTGWSSKRVKFSKGDPLLLLLVLANRDPEVFGGKAVSYSRAMDFDPRRKELGKTLLTNGLLSFADQEKLDRIGAKDPFLSVAQEVVEKFRSRAKVLRGESEDSFSSLVSDWRAPDMDHGLVTDELAMLGEMVWGVAVVCALAELKLLGEWGSMSSTVGYNLLSELVLVIAQYFRVPLLLYIAHILRSVTVFRAVLAAHSLLHGKPVPRRSIIAIIVTGGVVMSMVLFVFFAVGPATKSHLYACQCFSIVPNLLFFYMLSRLGGTLGGLAYLGTLYSVLRVANEVLLQYVIFSGDYYRLLFPIGQSLLLTVLCPAVKHLDLRVADTQPKEGRRRTPSVSSDEGDKHRTSHQSRRSKKHKWQLRTFILGLVALIVAVKVQAALGESGLSNPTLCPVIDAVPKDLRHMCDSFSLYKLDAHTRSMFTLMKSVTANLGEEPSPDGDVVQLPEEKRKLPKKAIGFGITIPTYDEDVSASGAKAVLERTLKSALFQLMKSSLVHPIVDYDIRWESQEHAVQVLNTARGRELDPLLLVDTDDQTSDEALARWCFAGLAAHTLVRLNASKGDKAVYMSDWRWLHTLEVREGFERYGAAVYFDEKKNPLRIDWSHANKTVYPNDADWAHAKWVFRCSCLMGVTMRDHLVSVHLLLANIVTTASRERLGPKHPLRRFLKPFTYGTVAVNFGASETLAVKNSFFHRATSLTWKGMADAFSYVSHHQRYTTARGILEKNGWKEGETEKHGYSFGVDFYLFSAVVRRLVEGYVDLYWKTDEDVLRDEDIRNFWEGMRVLPHSRVPELTTKSVLKDFLENVVVSVSALHNHVGNVGEYLVDPTYASGKIRQGREMADIQASFQ